jgi:hypothetical protein
MIYRVRTSQVESKVEAKPNIASVPKLRYNGGQYGRAGPAGPWRRRMVVRQGPLTLTTCCRLRVFMSRRSCSVPVHFGSSIVKEELIEVSSYWVGRGGNEAWVGKQGRQRRKEGGSRDRRGGNGAMGGWRQL